MRTYVRVARPQRRTLVIQRAPRPVAAARQITRAELAVPVRAPLARTLPVRRFELPDLRNLAVDPYLDYGRALTHEGGIRITYKDLDLRLRHTFWRLFAWSAATGLAAWYLFSLPPFHHPWISWALLVIVAIINWLIVTKPVEVYREIEVRPDCMIIEGTDLFWRRFMENGWPSFRQDAEGNFVLCGFYGTRFVEYLTIRRFDEFDRAPEVFGAHLRNAMQQLWTKSAV